MSGIEVPEWAERLVRLSESLLDAGVDWAPSFWEPPVRVEIRVRRGARLPPELVAEMKSALEMLRDLVARTATTEDLEELVRRCEEVLALEAGDLEVD